MYCVHGVIFSQAQELEWRFGNLNNWVLRKENNHAFWHRPKNVHYMQESTYTQRLMKNVGITQDFLSKTEVVVQYAYRSTGLTAKFHLSYAHCPLPIFLSTVPYLVSLSGGNINSQHTRLLISCAWLGGQRSKSYAGASISLGLCVTLKSRDPTAPWWTWTVNKKQIVVGYSQPGENTDVSLKYTQQIEVLVTWQCFAL